MRLNLLDPFITLSPGMSAELNSVIDSSHRVYRLLAEDLFAES